MENIEFNLAEEFALYTRKHCFVTGKAGTGKTTLLKKLAGMRQKNTVIVAPTGVAAVNAGGVTIHSMFGLPRTCYVPCNDEVDLNVATNRHRLLSEHLRLRKERMQVIRQMDLLIIDEVSMVRCDTLDALDLVLRTVRRNRLAFGGVQVLLIGDVHQLPPVAKEADWDVLRNYYRSPYFFDSHAWPELDAACIELQRVYRQSDARFLTLLNNIRHRRLNTQDYERLRERFDPSFKAADHILLTSHNSKADSVNASELANLSGRTHTFTAQIEGEFPEHLFPCDSVLHLKEGAHVMFIRNDSEGSAYFNGKLAVVKRIRDGLITVTFRDSGEDYTLHREIWENIGYVLEEKTGKIVKKELGTFSQYPLRLAWAITIHKSQGLTFDKVIIDAGRSFAAGQVYVALSRCRSLEGIVLHSLITPRALPHEPRIAEFSASYHVAQQLQAVLEQEKVRYRNEQLLKLFAFEDLETHLDDWYDVIATGELSAEKASASTLCKDIGSRMGQIEATAEKFQRQLRRLIEASGNPADSIPVLKERCAKAIEYFTTQIATQLIVPLRQHIDSLTHRKKMQGHLKAVRLIEHSCWTKIERLYSAEFQGQRLHGSERMYARDKPLRVHPAEGRVPAGTAD